jgi:3-methyladenine DNA glycosylase AlkD
MDAAAAITAEIATLPRRDTAEVRAVRRRWTKTMRTTPAREVLATAASLEATAGQTGKWVAYELIRYHPGAFAEVTEGQIADYAERCASWYAVDAFGTILSGPLWAKGKLPDALIEAWSASDNRWLRRSALVATVGLNAKSSGGPGDAGRTLAICRRLAADSDDMVEKALSWALRELSKRDRSAVEAFMTQMDETLPARVKREVTNKLTTGLKSPLNPRGNRAMVTGA